MLPQIEGVAAVIVQPAQTHGDAVEQGKHQAHQPADEQQRRGNGPLPQRQPQGQAQARAQQVQQASAQVIQGHRQVPGPGRRRHQALAAGAGHGKAAQAEAPFLPHHHQAAHPVGAEAVPGQQAKQQVAALVNSGLEEERQAQAPEQ